MVSAPSDSPFISPQSDLSKSADLIMPCSTYKALTFSCFSGIKAHLPRPAGEAPPGSCRSPPGPLHLRAVTLNSGPPFTPAPLSPISGPFPAICCAHPRSLVQGSLPQKLPHIPGWVSDLLCLLSEAVMILTTLTYDFFHRLAPGLPPFCESFF